jgi:predicted PurR-regulated permease PerM
VIQAIIFALVLWVIYELRDILLILLFAFIVMSGFRPIINKLEKLGLPRLLAILAPYLGVVLILGLGLYSVMPVVIMQVRLIAENFPTYLEQLTGYVDNLGLSAGGLEESLPAITQPVVDSILLVPGALAVFLVALAAVLFISIYLLWDEEYFRKKTGSFGSAHDKVFLRLESAMGAWVRGQIFIAFLVGLMSFIGLLIIGVEFALALAIITAILEFIPFVGPVIAAFIAALIAINDGWVTLGLVVGLYVVIQQVESNVLVPLVMKRSVHLHPVTIIIAILIGAHFLGIIGALAAVPIATIVTVLYDELYNGRHTAREESTAFKEGSQ